MNEFEATLRGRLIALVDQETGPRRQPPPFQPTHESVGRNGRLAPQRGPGRRRSLIVSLTAAACVVAVLLGTVGLSRLSSHSAPPPITTPTPTPTPSASIAPTPLVTPTNPSVPVGPAQPPTTRTTVVHLDGAAISLPAGWVARPMTLYGGDDPSVWCLTPAAQPVGNEDDYGCPVRFEPLDGKSDVSPFSESGYPGDASYCEFPTHVSIHRELRAFGGRPAFYRHWIFDCTKAFSGPENPQKPYVFVENYVVATRPGFMMVSEVATSSVDVAMAEIAGNSMLPQQNAPLPLYDVGYVRSATHQSGGVALEIDRVQVTDSGVMNVNPRTYTYVIPSALLTVAHHEAIPRIGSLEDIFTDGTRVVDFGPAYDGDGGPLHPAK